MSRKDEEKAKKKSQIKKDVAEGAKAISYKNKVLKQHSMNNTHRSP